MMLISIVKVIGILLGFILSIALTACSVTACLILWDKKAYIIDKNKIYKHVIIATETLIRDDGRVATKNLIFMIDLPASKLLSEVIDDIQIKRKGHIRVREVFRNVDNNFMKALPHFGGTIINLNVDGKEE